MIDLERTAQIKSEIAKLTVKIKELQERIDELEQSEQKSGRWKPEVGEIYFYISSHGTIERYTWKDSTFDNNRYEIGNCFPTEEATEFEIERLKVIAEMQEFAFEPDWGNHEQYKYNMYYNSAVNDIQIDYYTYVVKNYIYFESEGQIQACIDAVGKDRIKKYYFRIKEE